MSEEGIPSLYYDFVRDYRLDAGDETDFGSWLNQKGKGAGELTYDELVKEYELMNKEWGES